MKFIVIKPHKSNYPNPISLEIGEEVRTGDPYNGPENWPYWIYCYKMDNKNEGWVPEQIIDIKNEIGIISEFYTAKELSVDEGEILDGIRVLNGWIWCKKEKQTDEGWVPIENLERID